MTILVVWVSCMFTRLVGEESQIFQSGVDTWKPGHIRDSIPLRCQTCDYKYWAIATLPPNSCGSFWVTLISTLICYTCICSVISLLTCTWQNIFNDFLSAIAFQLHLHVYTCRVTQWKRIMTKYIMSTVKILCVQC